MAIARSARGGAVPQRHVVSPGVYRMRTQGPSSTRDALLGLPHQAVGR